VLRPPGVPFAPVGAVPLAVGLALLGWCIRDFHVVGQGTLAPWDPPVRLVVRGPYRHTRNPMYLAVLLIVVAWAVGFRSAPIGAYTAAIAALFHLRVVLGEEPWLARTHGAAWSSYVASVPRWLPRPGESPPLS
jgi:protein-S-isoprenylcysteine O-methyltransferase Ste14